MQKHSSPSENVGSKFMLVAHKPSRLWHGTNLPLHPEVPGTSTFTFFTPRNSLRLKSRCKLRKLSFSFAGKRRRFLSAPAAAGAHENLHLLQVAMKIHALKVHTTEEGWPREHVRVHASSMQPQGLMIIHHDNPRLSKDRAGYSQDCPQGGDDRDKPVGQRSAGLGQ